MIQQGFGDQSLSRAQVFQWHARFKTGRTSGDDDERTGRHTNCTTPETVARIQELIRQDRRLTIRDIAKEVEVDCVKKCEDIVPSFGENRPGCFTMTTHRLTLPSSPTSFWRKTKLLLSPTHHIPLIWHPVTSSYFLKWNWSWKDAGSIPVRRFRPKRRKCLTLWQKRTFRKRSKNGGDGGTGVYIWEGTSSRVTAADRPYGKFYDFYSPAWKRLDQPMYTPVSFKR